MRRDSILEALPVYALALLGLLFTAECGRAQDNRRLFLNRETVAIIEVKEVGPGVLRPDLGPIQSVPVTVEVVAHLPPESQVAKKQIITIDILFLKPGEGIIFPPPTQEWFPREPGKRLVVAFDGTMIPSKLAIFPVHADGFSPEETWRDCVLYYQAVSGPRADRIKALTKVLEEHRQALTPTFFELASGGDNNSKINDNIDYTLATVKYLEDRQIPLVARRDSSLLGALWPYKPRVGEGNKRLAAAIVQVALESKKAKVHPQAIGHILMILCQLCVYRRTADDLPKLDPAVHKDLLNLVLEKKVSLNQPEFGPLRDWLQGRTIGEVPLQKSPLMRPDPPPEVPNIKTTDPVTAKTVTTEHAAKREPPPAFAQDAVPAPSIKPWQTAALWILGLSLVSTAFALFITWRSRSNRA